MLKKQSQLLLVLALILNFNVSAQLSTDDQTLGPTQTIETDSNANNGSGTEANLDFGAQSLETPKEEAKILEEENPQANNPIVEAPTKKDNPAKEIKKNPKNSNTVGEAKVRSTDVFVEEKSTYKLNDSYKSITLNDVIEQGLRLNKDQNIRNLNNDINDLSINSAFRQFWLPQLKLTLVTAEQRIENLRQGSRDSTSIPSKRAAGSFGFEIGNYTVFNWGKDYAQYLNNKATYEREKAYNDEQKRELKLTLISNYLELVKKKNLLKVKLDFLRRASFIYRLNREKVNVQKTSQQDYYLSRSVYLEAQNDYQQAKNDVDVADENFAVLIGDKSGTKYIVNEVIDYSKLKITLDDALNSTKARNSDLINNKVDIELNERELDIARLDNLPLPKFTVNLGSYKNRFGSAKNTTNYETYSGTGAIELVASINATWDIFGADGLLNSDKLAKKRIDLELSKLSLNKTLSEKEASVQSIYKTIIMLQNQLLILEARLPSVTKTMETVLENYLDNKARFYDYKLALADYISTKTLYENASLLHGQQKLALATLMGVEDFPGENFEKIVTREKGK